MTHNTGEIAYSTQDDTIVLYQGLLTPALMALIAGLVIHSFIIGVNVTDWWKGRSVTPVDHVVTSLGISRLSAHCVITLYFIVITLSQTSLTLHIFVFIMNRLYALFTYTNIWLTSLLSIVLCLKISNLHTRLFLYLRRMILHRTGQVIVASVIFSASNSLMTALVSITKITNGEKTNTTMAHLLTNCINMNSIYSFIIAAFFPLLLYSISSILLFTSLYHHTTRMKMSSNLSINLETYYSMMKLVTVSFIYNTIFFFGHFVCIFYHHFYCIHLIWVLIILGFLTVLHSFYLTYKTTKLRNQMSKVLHNVIHFLFQNCDPETRVNIEMVAQ